MGTERTHREAALARIAERQFGVFTRAQAFDQGFTANTIKKRLHRGVWALADHNVYRMSATPRTWNQRVLAACLAGPAVASHRSAGILWGLPGMPNEIVEVTALRHRRRRAFDVNWHESWHLTERDIAQIEGIPCTRPVRTFLDLGVVLSPDELETVLNEGIRRNLLSRSAIGRRLDELGTLRPGTTVVQAVVGRHRPGRRAPESVLETRFLQLLRTAGLPEPAPQFEIGLATAQPPESPSRIRSGELRSSSTELPTTRARSRNVAIVDVTTDSEPSVGAFFALAGMTSRGAPTTCSA